MVAAAGGCSVGLGLLAVAGCCGEERLLLWCSLEAGVELLLEVGCRVICEGRAGEGRLCWMLLDEEGAAAAG